MHERTVLEMNSTKEKKLIKKYSDQWRKDNGYVDFLEHAEKEKKELNESYKESVRQTKERKAKEHNMGNVNFLKEGKFILCSKCLDNTPHVPAWGICQRCGTQYSKDL
jgi:DNA replication protein DnaC|tara:strand:+ start:514 stop:837 length:324 start_codon:yes stop_codon:yes gene_type:complete